MTSRRNTIQKDLVRNTVYEMRRHVTANEVYEFIKEAYPTIGKGTVYRNLDILVEEGALRKVEVPNGPNRFDFTLKNHYHVRCIKCGEIFDVDMDQIPDLLERIHNTHGIEFVDYDISFKGCLLYTSIKLMQEKIEFFKMDSGKISIEYNAISGWVIIINGNREILCQRDDPKFDIFKH